MNPYQAPVSGDPRSAEAAAAGTRRGVVWFWERGRLFYNGIQLLISVVMIIVTGAPSVMFWPNVSTYLFFAVVANVLYSFAYGLELVLRISWLRPYAREVRWLALIGGTLLACGLTVVVMHDIVLAFPGAVQPLL
jgi:hypothetical protein